MIPLSLGHLAAATAATLDRITDADAMVTAPLSFDSRDIAPGGLFACLPGRHTDGHDYAAQAVAAGATAVLATRPVGVPALLVPDVLTAMAGLAAQVAAAFTGTVIGVTGSAGKTTTKDILAAILTLDGPTVATQKSFNNEIGFPVTVSRVEENTAYLLLEMGARGQGHIASLCQIARPTIATVLGVGSAHIGEFGSREAIADAKAEIVQALPSDGVAVLNGDDPLVRAMAARTRGHVLTFGTREDSTVRATEITLDDQGRPRITLAYRGESGSVQLRIHGRHNATNALAAAATALAAGVPLTTVLQGLEQAEITSGNRMQVTTRPDAVTVINDSFNASPEAVQAAIAALGDIAGPRRRQVAVIGEMAELGDDAAAWHKRIADRIARSGIQHIVLVGGPQVEAMLDTIRASGVSAEMANPAVPLAEQVNKSLQPGDVVLIKGANALGLGMVADLLVRLTTA
ncbi:UDP-N-acetylmuramoyl-tripeptide--D-alanyl-D-alanine ligase [Actinacidiphila soli]|uniref:UDP-N-acetylmuramoyl-tripeptide--D-alanyl-D- alanine ligase n=1 Tax=Actinacidiphila soli TaxID=2487275 RepID=UPI000FCA1D82|nr:UDP-N-acetylmuramoyl-tripeptide--D-alanyl-D-alanine ligase [Actinacidiphila soli]